MTKDNSHKCDCGFTFTDEKKVSQEKPDTTPEETNGLDLLLNFHEQALVLMGEEAGRKEERQRIIEMVEKIEETLLKDMSWSEDASDYLKTIVIGNIRGVVSKILTSLKEESK